MNDNPNSFGSKLELIKASDIKPKQVRWLWYPYIPFGKVTLLQGDPGDGKSKLMLSLAALLSKGAPLPFSDDEESYEPVTIIYQTTEDDADDTVVPRFNAAGGDGERLVFIKEDVKRLTFGDDRIREAVEQCDAKLLILDPMSSYIGDDCSMNNANETRAEFNHLIAVAKDTGCAIVIIAHMNKAKDTSPLYRTNGSSQATRELEALQGKMSSQSNEAESTSGFDLDKIKKGLSQMVDISTPRISEELIEEFVEVVTPVENHHYRWKLNFGESKVPQERSNLMEPENPPVLAFTIDFETARKFRYANGLPTQFRKRDWNDLTVEVYL